MSLLPTSGQIVLYDTEFTSWPGFMAQGFKAPGRYPEVIQIGAVRIDMAGPYTELDTFEVFVIPLINPELSDYIIDLTGITQARLEAQGMPYPDALARFMEFIGADDMPLYSFGTDAKIMRKNCDLNGIHCPSVFEKEVNLKVVMAEAGLVEMKAVSSELPAQFGLAVKENGHDALADAQAVARVLRHLKAQGRID